MSRFDHLSHDQRIALASTLKAALHEDHAELDTLRSEVESEKAKLQVLVAKMGLSSAGALTAAMLAIPTGGLTLIAAVPNGALALLEVAQFTTDANYIRGLERRIKGLLRRTKRTADDLEELERLI